MGTAGNAVSCVPRLVTRIAGSARTHGATHSVTDLCHGDRDLQAPHLPGAHPGVPAIPAPHCHPALAIERNLHGLRVTNISTYTFPEPPKLQSKETFVKESSAQTVPAETPTMRWLQTQLQSPKHNNPRKSLPKRQMLLLEKLLRSPGARSVLPPQGKGEGSGAVGSGTARAKGKNIGQKETSFISVP